MLGCDAVAAIGHRNLDHVMRQKARSDADLGAWRAVLHRVADEVVEQLRWLRAIPAERREIGIDGEDDVLRALVLALAETPARPLRRARESRPAGWADDIFRLDSRERHEIVNQALHAAGLAVHDPQEPSARRFVRARDGIAQCLDEAQDAGQRRAQLVAGIGDEIDAHLLRRLPSALVGEQRSWRCSKAEVDGEFPELVRRAEPGNIDAPGAGLQWCA